jgi:hypothetical protein
MRDVVIDQYGTLRCPNCGGTNFDRERTGLAKVAGWVTIGVGLFLLPKRMRCLACNTWSRSGNARKVRVAGDGASLRVVTAPQQSGASQFTAPQIPSRAVAKKRARQEGRWHTGEGGHAWYWTNMWFCAAHDRARCPDCGAPPSFIPGRAGDPSLAARSQVRSEPDEPPDGQVESVADEIRRLAQLREERLLTDAEFEQAKRKLLG